MCCRPVVILADRDKEKMDEELRTALKGHCIEWHTRMGFPHSISDLQRVAAGQAKTVILLNLEGEQVALSSRPSADPHADVATQLCQSSRSWRLCRPRLLECLRSSVAGTSVLCGY